MDPAAADHAVMTVAEALELPVLKRGLPEVVAGAGGLGRAIRWVHAGEVPNMATLLSGGELLLTTGMGLSRRADAQRGFAAGLATRGVAAVVIEIPQPLRDTAEAHGLPLVALHREVPFVAVTEAIHTALVNRQYALLRRGEEIQQQLVSVMLGGDGIPEVLEALARTIGNPVFLETEEGRLLFHAGDGDGDALAAWEAVRGRGRDAESSGITAAVPMGAGRRPGRLAALSTGRPLDELDKIALRHAAGIVALALLRSRQEEELVVRERGNLLSQLADGALGGDEAAHQAKLMGFDVRRGLLLPVAADVKGDTSDTVWSAVLHELQAELSGRGLSVLGGAHPRDGQLLALVALHGVDHRAAVARMTAEAMRVAARRRRRDADLVVGVAAAVDWAGAGAELALASETAACARALPAEPWHDAGRLELQRLLWGIRGDEALARFVERNLGPILAHDRERKLTLLPTLAALCANGGRKAEAARALHLNRQALYRRIARMEALLNVDLGDPARLLTLQVALEATRFVEPQAS
jgi:purine catabolism regulator